MPNQREVILAMILGLAISNDIKTRRQMRKIVRLSSAVIEQHEENDARNHQKIEYLLHLLNKSNVKIDAFDEIALDQLDFRVKNQ